MGCPHISDHVRCPGPGCLTPWRVNPTVVRSARCVCLVPLQECEILDIIMKMCCEYLSSLEKCLSWKELGPT